MSTKISLLPGEQVVMSFSDDRLTLTTKRVRYDCTNVGRSNFISMTLDSVASVGLVAKSFPVLLVLAAIAAIGGSLFFRRGGLGLIPVAIVLVVAYLLTRVSLISIASKGGQSILLPAKGNRSSIVEFLEAVEREKLGSSDQGKI